MYMLPLSRRQDVGISWCHGRGNHALSVRSLHEGGVSQLFAEELLGVRPHARRLPLRKLEQRWQQVMAELF